MLDGEIPIVKGSPNAQLTDLDTVAAVTSDGALG